MDFKELFEQKFGDVIKEQLPSMIEKYTAEAVNDIVRDIFNWGDVKKQIKNQIEQSINVNLGKFDLIDYNALIANVINENLIQQVNLEPIKEMIGEIIGFVDKKTISLQEIADLFIDASREEHNSDYDGECTFIVESNEGYSFISVYADIDKDIEKSACSVQINISKRKEGGNRIFSTYTKREYYDRERHKITPLRMANFSSLEAKIFRLYSAQVSIIDLDEEINTYWSND